jgi:hypothetical protein
MVTNIAHIDIEINDQVDSIIQPHIYHIYIRWIRHH